MTLKQRLRMLRHPLIIQRLKSMLTAPPLWMVDQVSITPDQIEICGWALPPARKLGPGAFAVNGQTFPLQEALPTPALQQRFWYLAGAEASGYRCRIPLTPELFNHADHLTFEYIDRTSGQPFATGRSFHYPLHCTAALPSREQRRRVHGDELEDTFILTGYTNFMRLRDILQHYTGRDFDGFSSLLDWGCGCGRLGRYLGRFSGLQVTGVDIDPDNIAWCQNHFSFGEYVHIPLHPPTALPPASFDLLIGISIFTHLKESDQFDWLAELQRLAAPGAILLMTVHGPMAAARSGWNIFRAYLRGAGLLDVGRDLSLDEVIADKDYYRATFHTHDYIQQRWNAFFEVVAILPAAIGINQDLVVLRRR